MQSKPRRSHADGKETEIQTPGAKAAGVKGALAFAYWYFDVVLSVKTLKQNAFSSAFQECLCY